MARKARTRVVGGTKKVFVREWIRHARQRLAEMRASYRDWNVSGTFAAVHVVGERLQLVLILSRSAAKGMAHHGGATSPKADMRQPRRTVAVSNAPRFDSFQPRQSLSPAERPGVGLSRRNASRRLGRIVGDTRFGAAETSASAFKCKIRLRAFRWSEGPDPNLEDSGFDVAARNDGSLQSVKTG